MKKIVFLGMLSLFLAENTYAQTTTLNQAKYIATLNVITVHKMKDADLAPDLVKLKEYSRFKDELVKMRDKLDNSKPKSQKNQKIMKILERAGKEIYDELK